MDQLDQHGYNTRGSQIAKRCEYDRLCTNLCDGMKKLSAAMTTPENYSAVQELFKDFVRIQDACLKAEQDYLLTLSEDEQNTHSEHTTGLCTDIAECKEQVNQYLNNSTPRQEGSIYSQRRSGSVCSDRSSASMLRLREEQTRAEINAKYIAMQEKYELERAKRLDKLRLDKEIEMSRIEFERLEAEFELKTLMAISDAKSEVLDRFELSDGDSQTNVKRLLSPISTLKYGNNNPAQTSMSGFYEPKHIQSSSKKALNVGAQSFSPLNVSEVYGIRAQHERSVQEEEDSHPTERHIYPTVRQQNTEHIICDLPKEMPTTQLNVESHTASTDLNRLADLLARDYLPRMEPDIFDGNILLYPNWINSFESIIEERISSPVQRLFYLDKYTAGAAKEVIQGLITLRTPNAYREAKNILNERYGDKYQIFEAYKKRIRNWPSIKPNDGPELRRFSDFLSNCRLAMESISYLRILDDFEENQKMLCKLPRYLVDRWRRIVDTALHREPEEHLPEYPSFGKFCDFLKREARIACGPIRSDGAEDVRRDAYHHSTQSKRPNARNFATLTGQVSNPTPERNMNNGNNIQERRKPSCFMCKGEHYLDKCPDFLCKNVAERLKFVQLRRLCLRCLKWGHIMNDCRSKQKCDTCGRRHSTTLHDDSYQPTKRSTGLSDVNKAKTTDIISHKTEFRDSVNEDCFHSLIIPVQLFQKSRPDDRIVVYALLDPQSNACFMSERTVENIHASKHRDVHISLKTMMGESTLSCKMIQDLAIADMNNDVIIDLPGCYVREEIAASHDQIPRPETVARWTHLQGIANKLPSYQKDAEIGLLIGTNLSKVLKPLDCIPGRDNDPYAIRTILGWGVIGMMTPSNTGKTYCRSVIAEEKKCHFVFKTRVKEILMSDVLAMYDQDFKDDDSTKKLSIEDKRFLGIVTQGIKQRPDGHMEMPLPKREDNLVLPNNKIVATKRLTRLKNSFSRNPRYERDYKHFMNNIIENNYAEKVPHTQDSAQVGRTWYLPHHGVYHPQKTRKAKSGIRLQF